MEQQLQDEPSAYNSANQPPVINSTGGADASISPSDLEQPPGLTEDMATMEALARSLRRSSPVRDFAMNALAGTPSSNVQPLLDALAESSPRRWKERGVAAWLLGKLPLQPEQSQAAMQHLCEVVGTRQSNTGIHRAKRTGRRTARALSVAAIAGLAVTSWVFFMIGSVHDNVLCHGLLYALFSFCMGVVFYAVLLTPLVMPVSIACDKRRINRVRAAAATALGRRPYRQCVGVLARAALDKNRQVREAADTALRATLPTLAPEHNGQTSADEVADLCRLMFRVDEPLALQILGALSKVGDSSAISPVGRLTQRGCTHRVRETAAALLPLLYQREEEENASRMLLRASSATPSGPDVLLRPAHSVTEQSAGEMVRSSQAPIVEAVPTVEENANLLEGRHLALLPANV